MTPAERCAGLTRRERQVLTHMAEGLKATEIGHMLGISHKTVEMHISNLVPKLGVRRSVQAAVIAAKAGLV
jgi:DNA-binding NarL/FixJ family response regulator